MDREMAAKAFKTSQSTGPLDRSDVDFKVAGRESIFIIVVRR
jgi:hypothetical protein